MRCHYLSDLHLESQGFDAELPGGDVLIIAGDLCHAVRLDPERRDRYSTTQRDRVLKFIDTATACFPHVLLVAGNHDHYDGHFGETIGHLRRWLPGVTVLDDESVELGGTRFFGSTFWTNFGDRNEAAMNGVRRRMGEYFFVKVAGGETVSRPSRFQPEDALRAHDAARTALLAAVTDGKPTIVVTHHAPSLQGLNPLHKGNALDSAYASDLDALLQSLENVPIWVHGHTHIARTYRVGCTEIRSNAFGFAAKGQAVRGFSANASFSP